MKTNGGLGILLGILLVIAGTGTANAFIEGQAENLADIKFIHLEIFLNETAKEAGISLAKTKADVELRLRMAAIDMFGPQASRNPLDGCVLFVRIHALKLDSRSEHVYYVSVDAEQAATLPRSSAKPVVGKVRIWETAVFGTCDPRDLEKEVRETVYRILDRFTTDFRAANPKK
jgi:hypothetical protein